MVTASNEELLELNRRIIEAMPGGIVHVAANGAIQIANAEALRVLGLSYDALTHRYVQDFDPETIREDGTPYAAADYPVSRALATGRPQPPSVVGVRKADGEISWAIFTAVPLFVPGSSQVSGAVVTFLDITQRKRSEAALSQSESLLRSVLQSAPTPIVTTDLEGNIEAAMNELAATARVGSKVWERAMPEERAIVRGAFEKVVATGSIEFYEVTSIAGRRWRTHVGPRRQGGAIVGATFVSTDVTDLREAETRLAIADRMASIGTLVAGVAHEINNPLTYLLANLHWLQADAKAQGNERAREFITGAVEGAERIRDVVADVGSFSRSSDTDDQPIDLKPLIDGALRMAHNEIRHRARVIVEWGAVPMVAANAGRLAQVFLNLLVNAAQSIHEGNSDRNQITIRAFTDDAGRAVVEVSDTGAGIEPSLLGRIFDPFVTTKPRGVGTGLGLYICKNVVASLKGELTVVSRVGEGSTFKVVLPAIATAARPRAAAGSVEARPSRRLKILVADDELAIGRVMREFLSDHEVEVAVSGRDAIAKLHEREFDLVFCDLVMPDLTGVDVYQQLKQLRPGHEARMVMMTGGAFTERTRGFLDAIPNPLLEKPFTSTQVMAAVASSYERP